MLEDHIEAYAAARQHLYALSASADSSGDGWVRYNDLLTALETLHDPGDLPSITDPPALPRADHYHAARRALGLLRDRGFVDPLEASLLIGNLAAAWDADPDRDTPLASR